MVSKQASLSSRPSNWKNGIQSKNLNQSIYGNLGERPPVVGSRDHQRELNLDNELKLGYFLILGTG
jgi:hypothetical protein